MRLSSSPVFPVFTLLVTIAGAAIGSTSDPAPRTEKPSPQSTCDLAPFQMEWERIGNHETRSKATSVNGAKFQAVVNRKVRVPAVGEESDIGLALCLTNTSSEPKDFYLGYHLTVTAVDGKPLRTRSEKGSYAREYNHWTFDAGKARLVRSGAALEWSADGKTLRLRVWDEGSDIWFFEDLHPGQYLVTLNYDTAKSADLTDKDWVGKANTEPVRFEIVPTLAGMKQSRPVRAQGVDFQTVVEPTWVCGPIAMGVSITNHTAKPLLFDFTETLDPILRNAAGKKMKYSYEREEEGEERPVFVDSGKTETRLYCAYLDLDEGQTLRLWGSESGGEWAFSGLEPGKYLLSLQYKNNWDMPNKFSIGPKWHDDKRDYWFGELCTEEIAFEILPPKKLQPRPRR